MKAARNLWPGAPDPVLREAVADFLVPRPRAARRASNLHAVPAGPPEVPRTMEGVPMCSGRVAHRCFSHFG